MAITAHRELTALQSGEHAMIAHICIAGVKRPRLFQRTVQCHKCIVRLVGVLNCKLRNDTVECLLRKRQRLTPPIENVCVHAKRGNVCILCNLMVWRNRVNLRVRTELPEPFKILRTVDDEEAEAFCTRRKEIHDLRPHRTKSPRSAHKRSISSVNAAR